MTKIKSKLISDFDSAVANNEDVKENKEKKTFAFGDNGQNPKDKRRRGQFC